MSNIVNIKGGLSWTSLY